jgi:hypothetical protein
VRAALQDFKARYRASKSDAENAVHVGESTVVSRAPTDQLAAWTLVANLILNLDETVNRN